MTPRLPDWVTFCDKQTWIPTALLVLLIWLPSVAQISATDTAKLNAGAYSAYQSVSLQLGTTGPRIYYNRTVGASNRLMLRVGAQYIGYGKLLRIDVDKGAFINLQPDFAIGMAEAGIRWQAFRQRAFYLSAGVAYNWHPNLNVVIFADDKLTFGGLELTADNIGVVDLGLRWRSLMPYLGLGVGKPSPKHRFSVGAELGVFYLGKPRVNLAYTGFLETTTIDEQVVKVENNLSGYRWLPSLNLALVYRLNRHPYPKL